VLDSPGCREGLRPLLRLHARARRKARPRPHKPGEAAQCAVCPQRHLSRCQPRLLHDAGGSQPGRSRPDARLGLRVDLWTTREDNRKELGPSEVKQYVKTFNQKQANLREEFKRFGALGCEKKNDALQVPTEVYEAPDTKVTIEIRARPV
jgi:hypothetical protein